MSTAMEASVPLDASGDPVAAAAEPRRLVGRAVRGGAVLLAARLTMQLFVWAVTLVVARILHPDDYGLMTLATGSRGQAARTGFASKSSPSCEQQGEPCAKRSMRRFGARHRQGANNGERQRSTLGLSPPRSSPRTKSPLPRRRRAVAGPSAAIAPPARQTQQMLRSMMRIRMLSERS